MKKDADAKGQWLDDNFEELPREKLLDISKGWNATEWETYLHSTEGSQRELLTVDPLVGDWISQEERDERYYKLIDKESYPHLEEALLKAVATLPVSQQYVIKKYFWEGQSLNEIARKVGVTKAAIQSRRTSALKRLGTLFMTANQSTRNKKMESENGN